MGIWQTIHQQGRLHLFENTPGQAGRAMSSVVIEFPFYVSRLWRTPVMRGLWRWTTERGYPMELQEARGWLRSRCWVRIRVPGEAEASVRVTLSGLDTKRRRQLRWAWTQGRGMPVQRSH
ncbi:hypothetical protein [Nocardia wallacei]|uniref:hypothetical protein n=1 Tax=Nocardia wallacei TaxID=480035 RepID=UPI002453C4C0|nr:hypothetical protein [Nocardia wallacei]